MGLKDFFNKKKAGSNPLDNSGNDSTDDWNKTRESLKNKAKAKMGGNGGNFKDYIISKTLLNYSLYLGVGIGGFIGSRAYELGVVGEKLNNYKGATVFVSGPCKTAGRQRVPALTEDEVKITGQEYDEENKKLKKIIGVVRATREVVECDMNVTTVDALPLTSKIGQKPLRVPDINSVKVKRVADQSLLDLVGKTVSASGICKTDKGSQLQPFTDERLEILSVEATDDGKQILRGIKKIDKSAVYCDTEMVRYKEIEPFEDVIGKTIVASGICKNDKDSEIPAFTDEKIDVLSVVKGETSDFVLKGIKKSDKTAVFCKTDLIRYKIDNETKPVTEISVKKSYVGKVVLVTGVCIPDPRIPRSRGTQNIAFIKMLSSKVEVTEEVLNEDGSLRQIAGVAYDHGGGSGKNLFENVVCGGKKYPVTFSESSGDDSKGRAESIDEESPELKNKQADKKQGKDKEKGKKESDPKGEALVEPQAE